MLQSRRMTGGIGMQVSKHEIYSAATALNEGMRYQTISRRIEDRPLQRGQNISNTLQMQTFYSGFGVVLTLYVVFFDSLSWRIDSLCCSEHQFTGSLKPGAKHRRIRSGVYCKKCVNLHPPFQFMCRFAHKMKIPLAGNQQLMSTFRS
jgi:hypothetical protein